MASERLGVLCAFKAIELLFRVHFSTASIFYVSKYNVDTRLLIEIFKRDVLYVTEKYCLKFPQ